MKGNKEPAKQQPKEEPAAQLTPTPAATATTKIEAPTTTGTIATDPGHLARFKVWFYADGLLWLFFIACVGVAGVLWKLRQKDVKAYKQTLKLKENEIKNLKRLLAEAEANNSSVGTTLNNSSQKLLQANDALIEAKSDIKRLKSEKQAKWDEAFELSQENLKLTERVQEWQAHVAYIEEQYQAHADELERKYEVHKADLAVARNDEIEQIRQNGELIRSKIKEEYAFKERERVKELTEARVELEEMTKLVKEKNPTMYTAVQKELRGRVQARLNADNRKEAKKEEKRLVANEQKMHAPAD
jgi:hypothetical protein